jgi:hypothetical protein
MVDVGLKSELEQTRRLRDVATGFFFFFFGWGTSQFLSIQTLIP